MKLTSNRAGRLIQKDNYQYFLPNYLADIYKTIEVDDEMTELRNKAYFFIGKVNGICKFLDVLNVISDINVKKEAVYCSQIENIKVTILDLLSKNPPQIKKNDIQKVKNYVDCSNYSFATLKNNPLTTDMVIKNHTFLKEENNGKVRDTQNFIGVYGATIHSATYVPPDPKEIKNLIIDLENFINDQNQCNTLIKAALIHYQFETIHPFNKGNGRIGRLLNLLFLKEKDVIEFPSVFYPSLFLKKNREMYYQLLNDVRFNGSYEKWIKFFFTCLIETCVSIIRNLEKFKNLREKDLEKINKKSETNKEKTILVYEHFIKNPITDALEISNNTKISKPTVYSILNELLKLEIIEVNNADKIRYKEYVYREFINIIEDDSLY